MTAVPDTISIGRSVIFLPTIGGDNFRIIDVPSKRESPLSRMSIAAA